ncbi:histidine kinase [Agrobacterium tumefaciens]|mgnify:CR=1 FL=1|jgi:CHASE3 domain sensor protein/two-component sensor histidine kinase|uniref:histidine kinase n=1 Tax=Agrobacterium fabrum (strain C58 / ATCC 33970) TaxID=176299 RepID=Q7CY49_AGRFC|nr:MULTISPECIES: CHASE3 domain-containing protein [Agrobacterium]KEY50814.1 histidine kinase [Agrobacterium tumefaciens]AAK87744.2 two component sensor kinase [Agrobacterium fabrum str. C58]EGL61913.1 two component sensor kinase [Agrobacterium sp. ATCC 31749]MCX2876986.1 CHASE3 domain-containing protein [Agrobacterium fabrum]NMV72226.1 histidine kinase [Agrobacterium fabrum]
MLAVGVAILIGMVSMSLWLVQVNNRYSQETAELRRFRAAVLDVLTTMQDIETGQRGYLLTNNRDYLGPYEEALRDLPQRQSRLFDLLKEEEQYKQSLSGLRQAIDAKLAETRETIDLQRSGRITEAVEVVRNNDGKRFMNEIRIILSDLQSDTDDRLRIIVADQLGAANTLRWVTVGGAFAILIVVGGSIFLVFTYVRALNRSREDVGELNRHLEERVEERTRDLRRANQEIQRFAYIVTHDLRAPLVNIMGFLSEFDTSLKPVTRYVLADGESLPEDVIREARLAVEEDIPEAIGFIRSSTRKMDQLINAILKISRDGQRKLQPEKVDIETLLSSLSETVRHQINANGGEIEVDTPKLTIVTDRISLDQILGNLFDNAVKYQMPGRPLRLTARAYPAGRGAICIEVADNGRGIGEQDLERVFELFRRAGSQDQPGEGIGLAHVRSLIRNLGGDIKVESKLGEGSTFVLLMPSDLRRVTKESEK